MNKYKKLLEYNKMVLHMMKANISECNFKYSYSEILNIENRFPGTFNNCYNIKENRLYLRTFITVAYFNSIKILENKITTDVILSLQHIFLNNIWEIESYCSFNKKEQIMKDMFLRWVINGNTYCEDMFLKSALDYEKDMNLSKIKKL